MKTLIITTWDNEILSSKNTNKTLDEIIEILSNAKEWGNINKLFLFDENLNFEQYDTTHMTGNPVEYELNEIPNLLEMLKILDNNYILPINIPNYKVKKIIDYPKQRNSSKEISHFEIDGIEIATYKIDTDLFNDPNYGSMLRTKRKIVRNLDWNSSNVEKLTGYRPNTNSKTGNLRDDYPSLRGGYQGSTYTAKSIKIMIENFVIYKELEKLI
jgi:hypothetical protein